jgi:hypothetical protein
MTDAQLPITIDNNTGNLLDENENNQEQIIEDIFDNKDNAQKTSSLIASFVESYSHHKNTLALDVWLEQKFANHSELWASNEERHSTVLIIINTITRLKLIYTHT